MNDTYADENNEWTILIDFSNSKILSKYAGTLRFGPTYIHIKTVPENIFGKHFFGDWFYRTKKGVYLQKWNSNPVKNGVFTKANNDLVYYNSIEHEIETIKTGIKSFLWKMKKDENNELFLISNNGKIENRIKINS
jgi:hypothetical protein